jgi:hypothetical protein
MGRETHCMCEWNDERAEVKALLEPPELILRGAIRRRIPFSAMKRVRANGCELVFAFEGGNISLSLGDGMAVKWAKVVLAPLPSLAKKLGIESGSHVRVLGKVDDAALSEAISGTQGVTRRSAHSIIARVNTRAELQAAFAKSAKQADEGAMVWIVYRKGPGHAINEADVRSAGLTAGLVDVKVVSVSPQLTGLKFVRRRTPAKK